MLFQLAFKYEFPVYSLTHSCNMANTKRPCPEVRLEGLGPGPHAQLQGISAERSRSSTYISKLYINVHILFY